MRNKLGIHRAGRARQRGQALTEFLVIAVVLVPLFLLVPVIAKYQDLVHMTQLASRYAAWDSVVRNGSQNAEKPIDQLEQEVRRRFFGSSDAPIKTGDAAGDFRAHQNLFWRDPADRALIASFMHVTVARSIDAASDGTPAYRTSFGGAGIASASVSIKLANLPSGLSFYEPFDRIDLSMRRGSSVLVDAWTGKGPDYVEAKFGPLVPGTRILPALSVLVDPVMHVVELDQSPPMLGKLEFWRDVVPQDRLVSR